MLTKDEAVELASLMRRRAGVTRDDGEPVEVVRARYRGYFEAAFGADLNLPLSGGASSTDTPSV